MHNAPDPGGQARIGPNAVLRVVEALDEGPGAEATRAVMEAAGLDRYLSAPPAEMVDEREVIALHQALRELLGAADARAIGREAGRKTGDYLLANRIPRPAQILLRFLPASLAAPLLIRAISCNAWTFVGGGTFRALPGHPRQLEIVGCRVCAGAHSHGPVCDYYAGSFERLFQVLVSPWTRVHEVRCQALGDPACTFELRLDPG